VFLKNGQKVFEQSGTAAAGYVTADSGAYRVEVYRDDLGPPFDKMPWIISNAIDVR